MRGIGKPRATAIERCAFIVGWLCLGASIAAHGGGWSEWLDLPAEFAPFWLTGGLAVASYGLIFARRERRAALIVIGTLAAVVAGALIGPEFVRPIPRVALGGRTIKLIQFNAWDENHDPGVTATWIAGERPDLVLVEETEPVIDAALLARGFIRTSGAGHVAIFSRATPVGGPAPLAPDEWLKMPPFARATFWAGVTPYTVVAVHLPQPIYRVAEGERRMLATFASRYDRDHLIIAGDFNLTPWSFALRGLDRSLAMRRLDRAQFSWPGHLDFGDRRITTLPFLPIDHVYAGSAWRLVSLKRGPPVGSDHFPLEVVLSARTDGSPEPHAMLCKYRQLSSPPSRARAGTGGASSASSGRRVCAEPEVGRRRPALRGQSHSASLKLGCRPARLRDRPGEDQSLPSRPRSRCARRG